MKKIILFLSLVLILFSNVIFSQTKLNLQGGIQFPSGDFSDAAGTGYGGSATFEYKIPLLPISLTGMIGYYYWGENGDIEGVDYSYNSIPFMVGGRYYLSSFIVKPYFGAELGLNVFSSDIEYPRVKLENTDTKFSIAPMFGIKFGIGILLDFDVNVKYNVITTDPSVNNFGVNAGLSFGF